MEILGKRDTDKSTEGKEEREGRREGGRNNRSSGHMKVVAMASRPGHISTPESYLTESFLITTAALMTNSYISFRFSPIFL